MANRRLRINATLAKAQEEDLKKLEAFFKSRSFYPLSHQAEIEAAFKIAHKAVYGLSIWSEEFSQFPMHRRVFLEELRSDVLQSIYLALLGFRKPVALLLRSAIEDLLRHMYYFDHPIEFEKLEATPSSYETISNLWQYAKKHPRLEKLFESSKSIVWLENEHAIQSRFVHSTSTYHMNLTKTLSEIEFDMDFFNDYTTKVSLLAKNVHFVLFAFYQKEMAGFNPPWKSFIWDSIPALYRRVLCDNV